MVGAKEEKVAWRASRGKKMLKYDERSRNVYENKEKDDNFTEVKGDIFARMTTFDTKRRVFDSDRRAFDMVGALGNGLRASKCRISSPLSPLGKGGGTHGGVTPRFAGLGSETVSYEDNCAGSRNRNANRRLCAAFPETCAPERKSRRLSLRLAIFAKEEPRTPKSGVRATPLVAHRCPQVYL